MLENFQEYTQADFDHSPFIVFWEITQACDLICKHCRASAQPDRHPEEIQGDLCLKLIHQLAQFPYKPTLILTGGDPMKREDVFDIVRWGTEAGLPIAMTPSVTPLLTEQALCLLKECGLKRIAFSLDGADALTHDGIRGISGSFKRTLHMIKIAYHTGIPIQINTTISKRNFHQVNEIAEFISHLNITLWSVFFLIPVGRAISEERIEPQQYEEIFYYLWRHSETKHYNIKTTEAPQYRRFVLQCSGNPQKELSRESKHPKLIRRSPLGLNDGKGCLFISHKGEIFPSGFLPIEAGRFPKDSIVSIYQEAPIFKALRDPDGLKGKCGRCEFRRVCGGSRARAFAVTGDYLASEPDCLYEPNPKCIYLKSPRVTCGDFKP